MKYIDCRLSRNRNNNRCLALNSIKNKPKKNFTWKDAKTKYPKLSPCGDAEDKVKNRKDCRPFNKKKQDNPMFPYLGQEVYVDPKTYKAIQMIKYGKEMGLGGKETHNELKSHGYTSDEMRTAMSLFNESQMGLRIEPSIGIHNEPGFISSWHHYD